MTDFTPEEMLDIIARSLAENAARMREKYKLHRPEIVPSDALAPFGQLIRDRGQAAE